MTESLDFAWTDEMSFVKSDLHGDSLLSLHKESMAGGPRLYDQFYCVVEICNEIRYLTLLESFDLKMTSHSS